MAHRQKRPDNGSTFDETAPSVDALSDSGETATPPAVWANDWRRSQLHDHSGTNNFHGSAYDILRKRDLDANTYFNDLNMEACNTAGCRSQYMTPEDTKNDYGLTLGGPVIIPHIYNGKNKTFFFFAWECDRVESVHRSIGLRGTNLRPAIRDYQCQRNPVPDHAVCGEHHSK